MSDAPAGTHGLEARLPPTPISELVLIIAVAAAQLWRWHNGAVPAEDGSDGPTHSGVASPRSRRTTSSSSTAADNDRAARRGHRKRLSDDGLNRVCDVFIITS